MNLSAFPRIAAIAIAAIALLAATWQNSGTLFNQGDVVQQRCDQGQSQAVIEIPATTAPGPHSTSTPGPWGGLIYFETATSGAGANASPNPFGSPLAVTPANSTTYTNDVNAIPTSGPELKYYLTLGADQWVQARLASPDPNLGTATVKITCTTAVAARGGGGSGGSPLPSIPPAGVLGNPTGATAPPTPATLSAVLDQMAGSTQGMLLCRGSSGWQAISAGTNGQQLAGTTGSCPTWTATPSPPPGYNQVSFNSTAAFTNYNPQGAAHASSAFQSTVAITAPSTPFTLRIRAIVETHSLSNPSYYGILAGASNSGPWLDADMQETASGYIEAGIDCTVSVCGAGGYASPHPLPSATPQAGQYDEVDMQVTVTSSNQAMVSISVDGSTPQYGGAYGNSGKYTTSWLSVNVNLTGTFYLYCLGAASTDCPSVYYSTAQNVADNGGGGQYSFAATSPLQANQSGNTITYSCPLCPGQTTFEQAVKNFCTAGSYVCDYWCLCETSGSTAFDAIGSHNGTYPGGLTNGANYDAGEPMGMLDQSVGVDMWYGAEDGLFYVTGLPTPSPASEWVMGVIVRDCEEQSLSSNTVYLFDTYTPGGGANTGQGIYLTSGAMDVSTGNGTSITNQGALLANYNPTCHPKLLMMNSSYSGGVQDGYFQVNNIPNIDGFTSVPFSGGIALNAYNNGSGWEDGGKGEAFCCAFVIYANLGTTQLAPIQNASSI